MKKFPTRTPKRRTRLLSSLSIGALLVTGLVVGPHSSANTTASASEPACSWDEGRDGLTPATACRIGSRADLEALRDRVNESDGRTWSNGKYFIQTATIDLVGESNWDPIGNNENTGAIFYGRYNGDDYSILNLQITGDSDTKGLFGRVGDTSAPGTPDPTSEASETTFWTPIIENLRVVGVQVSGKQWVAGLAAFPRNSILRNVAVVTGTVIGERGAIRGTGQYVAGIAGQPFDSDLSGQVVFIGEVHASTSTRRANIGGIAGRTSGETKVATAYARGVVTGGLNPGGLIGDSSGGTSTFSEMYGAVIVCSTEGDLVRDPSSGVATGCNNSGNGGAVVGRISATNDDFKNTIYWDTERTARGFGHPTTETDSRFKALGLETSRMQGGTALTGSNMTGLAAGDGDWVPVTVPTNDYPVFDWQRGDEREATITVTNGEGGPVVEGADVSILSSDPTVFGDIPAQETDADGKATLSFYDVPHRTITASFTFDNGVTLSATIERAVGDDTSAFTLALVESTLTVSGADSSVGQEVSQETTTPALDNDPAIPITTFTAGQSEANLRSGFLADQLVSGNVRLRASGDIFINNWTAPSLTADRTLFIDAGNDVTVNAAGLASSTANRLTVRIRAGGSVSIDLTGASTLTLGSVIAEGDITVKTTDGDITITRPLQTTPTAEIRIGAGFSSTEKDYTKGDVVFDLPAGLSNNAVFDGHTGPVQIFGSDLGESFFGFETTRLEFNTLEGDPNTDPQAGSRDVFLRGPERPGFPTIILVPRAQSIEVTITAPSNATSVGVTGYAYCTDPPCDNVPGDWTLFDDLTPQELTGTFTRTIPGLTDGDNVSVQIAVVTTVGGDDVFTTSPASDPLKPGNPALSGLSSSVDGLAALFDAQRNLPQYALVVPTATTELTVTPTAKVSSASITVNVTTATGNVTTAVDSGEESEEIPLVIGQNTITIQSQVNDAIQTITLLVTRQAPPAPPTQQTSPRPPRPQVEEPLPGVFTIPSGPTRPTTTPTPPPTPTATGPTLVGGQPPVPSPRPEALIGGVPTPVTSAAVGQTGVRLSAGTLDLGVRVNTPDQGTVGATPEGEPELSVVKGQQTLISGSGVAPGSTVQAFLPLAGTNAVELGRIQADATGTFSGAAVLNTATTQAPLPVGRQVLQILGVDEGGNQTVINMTINIAQPPPQPEINRENQEVPVLGVGQSLATEAGLPVAVRVIPVPENKQTLIEGDGWTMGVSVAGEGADVTDTGDGDVRLTLVRNETAEVSGSGFMPFTRADVWLFSDPTLLGTVDIDENGEFNGVVNVDGNVVAVGEHTLQLQGVGEDGYVRAANLGVVVGENPDLVPSPTATTSLTWLLWVAGGVALLVAVSLLWWWRRRLSTVA